MAILNYTERLSNISNRKFDDDINESIVSKSLSSRELPENIKYLIESMRPIDKKYNSRTLEAAENVKKHLECNLNLSCSIEYKTQGSFKTDTNIKVYSDIDVLTIINSYYFLELGLPNDNIYSLTSPDDDIKQLRKQATRILTDIYDEIDTTKTKSISIFNKSFKRKVDIVFCFWYHSKTFIEKLDEHYKGIYLYEFPTKTKTIDFPFATINCINAKGENTNNGSKMGIRLLKNLKVDGNINLSSFQLATIVHNIDERLLYFNTSNHLQILNAISDKMDLIINSSIHRKGILSPNNCENPLKDDEIVTEIIKIKNDLDILILDTSKELNNSRIKFNILNY